MYGKHHSEEALMEIGAAQRGRHHSIETRRKHGEAIRGEHNPFYGKQHSEETLAKLSAATTGERHPFYGKHHTEEALAKMGAAKTNERNPNWHGGVSFEPYPINWTRHFRETIRKRDNYTCTLCGKPQGKRRHSIHHINYVKGDLRLENLVTLCSDCHRKTNDDREYWENLFMMVYVPDFSELITIS